MSEFNYEHISGHTFKAWKNTEKTFLSMNFLGKTMQGKHGSFYDNLAQIKPNASQISSYRKKKKPNASQISSYRKKKNL